MMGHIGDLFRDLCARVKQARTVWKMTTKNSFTDAEHEAIERAFKKCDEVFHEIDTVFKGWRH